MLSSGATTAEIVKKLRVSKNYVYLIGLKMKNDKPTKVEGQVLDTNAQEWAKRNPWFGSGKAEDVDKTAVALAAHEKVLRSGVVVNSDKYYARIDAQMRKYDKDMVSHPPHYKLTTSQMAVANELGVAKEAYAEELKKLDRENIVNHPPHYTVGGIEVIDFIEAKGMSYHLGNVVKYVARAGKKDDALQDLQKARWYLERAIQRAE